MRALVTPGAGGLEMRDVAEPDTPPGHVKIHVLRAGICGTDLHIDAWDAWAQSAVTPGLTVGHEFTGEVVDVAGDVDDIEVGQLVSAEGHVVCGKCRNCRAGRRHLCIRTSNLGVQRNGAFADWVVVPATNVWVHPGRVASEQSPEDLDVLAIYDPFGNAVHTALKFPVVGEDVLVTGAGPIGLMAAAVVRHVGARHVLVTDISPERIALARSMGFEAIDVRTQTIEDAQVRFGMREGFDVALEMSGAPAALPAIIDNLNFGGKVAMLGLPAQDIRVDWAKVVSHMLTIQGIYGREMYETWYTMTALAETGLDVSPVVTHRFPMDAWSEAFTAARSGTTGKVVLDMTEGR